MFVLKFQFVNVGSNRRGPHINPCDAPLKNWHDKFVFVRY